MGSPQFPPYRAVGRTQENVLSAQKGAVGIVWNSACQTPLLVFLCLSLSLLLSFWDSVLDTSCPRILKEPELDSP